MSSPDLVLSNPSELSLSQKMLLEKVQLAAFTHNVWDTAEPKSQGFGKPNKAGDAPVIKYYFVNTLPAEAKKNFEFAREEWMKYAYVKFQETKTRSEAHIEISFPDKGGATSDVGRKNVGATTMSFGPDFRSERNFLHEFGHALSFEHEHQRPDRKAEAFCERQPRGMDRDFWEKNFDYIVNPYSLKAASPCLDKESIMIYPMNENEKLTEKLSDTDKAFAMLMYPGRLPGDLSLHRALEIAGIKDPAKKNARPRPATDIKRFIRDKEYEKARDEFTQHNKKVLDRLKVKYKDYELEGKKTQSTGKSDVGTNFEDFLHSGAVEEAVEWVANQTDDSDE